MSFLLRALIAAAMPSIAATAGVCVKAAAIRANIDAALAKPLIGSGVGIVGGGVLAMSGRAASSFSIAWAFCWMPACCCTC